MKRWAIFLALPAVAIAGFGVALSVPASAAPEDSLAQAIADLRAANRISGQSNSYRRDNPNEYARVVAYLDGGSRPDGNLTRLGLGLVRVEDARRELVGEPDPTTTTTTTTAPPFSGDCRASNYTEWEPEDCSFASEVVVTNAQWSCPSTVSAYPVRVRVRATGRYAGNASTFNNGCRNPVGWDADRIAFIMLIEGSGISGGRGAGADVFKFRPFGGPGPGPITMTIRGECGPPDGGAHPDFMQNQAPHGAGPITVVNARSGDYDAGVPTCQAAGGMLFWSSGADITVIGAKLIGCNHGLNGGGSKHGSGSTVRDSQFRTGSANHPNCGGFATSNPCINTQGMTLSGLTCERFVSGSWQVRAPSP